MSRGLLHFLRRLPLCSGCDTSCGVLSTWLANARRGAECQGTAGLQLVVLV
jgi:hypothetical protein